MANKMNIFCSQFKDLNCFSYAKLVARSCSTRLSNKLGMIKGIFAIMISIYLILSLALVTNGEIIKTTDLTKINSDFLELSKNYQPQDILIVIGVQKVILKSLLPETISLDKNAYSQLNKIFQQIKPSHMIYFDEILFMNYKNLLLEPNLPKFIKEVNDSGTAIIATSKGLTGNLNNISHLEIWRADYLKKFNIDFSHSFPENNYIIFNNMKSFQNTYPTFYNGILNSNNSPQFKLILNFLIYLNFMPKVLIMIDNNLDELKSMEIQLRSYSNNVMFIGYHYTALNQTESKQVSSTAITKLLQELVNKVNKVTRNNVILQLQKQKNINPYDNKE